MEGLSRIGRIFYGIAVAETGLHTIYFHDFPYWLVPPEHSGIPGLAFIAYLSGFLMFIAGMCIVLKLKIRQASILLGSVLFMIFCFWHVPYELIVRFSALSLVEIENAEKELAFATGAFVIAGCFSGVDEKPLIRSLGKMIPAGPILFSLMIIGFGLVHVNYAKEASGYVPTWVPNPVFWMYFTGIALLGSGLAIIIKFKTRLIAALLGSMIFTWFVVLHIPRIVVSPGPYLGSEITSAMLALAYSGIAFVIAGEVKASANNARYS
jgi:uncharacterized membrane protein YphA (DoxX/SURF4 family)